MARYVNLIMTIEGQTLEETLLRAEAIHRLIAPRPSESGVVHVTIETLANIQSLGSLAQPSSPAPEPVGLPGFLGIVQDVLRLGHENPQLLYGYALAKHSDRRPDVVYNVLRNLFARGWLDLTAPSRNGQFARKVYRITELGNKKMHELLAR